MVPESDWERAQVKWFNRVRGFGFLTRGEGTPDIFIHMETLRRFGFTELRPDQIVQVRWGHGSKGCMAAELRLTAPNWAAAEALTCRPVRKHLQAGLPLGRPCSLFYSQRYYAP